ATMKGFHRRAHHALVAGAAGVLALTLLVGVASGAPQRRALPTSPLDTLPIANGLPLTLGINKGFFAAQGLEIKSTTLQSGNDIVLAMSNNQANIGYVGYVPAMIARTSGIPITIIAASDDEGTSTTDNWQDILVKGSSSIQTPAQLAGKTIAVNALKGVGEVVIRAALKKSGVDPNSVNLVAMPFPTMRTALNNAQAHPEEITPLLPAGTPSSIHLPVWSSLIDRQQLLQLAQYAKEFGVITTLPNFTKLISSAVVSGKFLQATVGPGVFVTLR